MAYTIETKRNFKIKWKHDLKTTKQTKHKPQTFNTVGYTNLLRDRRFKVHLQSTGPLSNYFIRKQIKQRMDKEWKYPKIWPEF